MKFLIVTHLIHTKSDDGKIYGYGPYIREMNVWLKYVDAVKIVSPLLKSNNIDPIETPYEFNTISFSEVPALDFTSLTKKIRSSILLPWILIKTIFAMFWADHIHIRCPGNMGLVGMACQILFPFKTKTIKYAGNWEDYPNEHLTYKIQKRLIRNTILTHKAKAIIYGEWPDFTRNCVSFFTASYSINQANNQAVEKAIGADTINLLFVGTLDERKRPDLCIHIVRKLIDRGVTNINLCIVGQGPYAKKCSDLVTTMALEKHVQLIGNIPINDTIQYYKNAHFVILLSRMEGWPKVIAEAMFWGCVPVTTRISCVPWMVDNGNRGILVEQDADRATEEIKSLIEKPIRYSQLSSNARLWSRQYTLESFDSSVKKLIVDN